VINIKEWLLSNKDKDFMGKELKRKGYQYLPAGTLFEVDCYRKQVTIVDERYSLTFKIDFLLNGISEDSRPQVYFYLEYSDSISYTLSGDYDGGKCREEVLKTKYEFVVNMRRLIKMNKIGPEIFSCFINNEREAVDYLNKSERLFKMFSQSFKKKTVTGRKRL